MSLLPNRTSAFRRPARPWWPGRGALIVLTLLFSLLFARQLPAQDKNSFAQRLVNEVSAKHKPDLIYLGLHGQTPKSKKSAIFASTDPAKIGKKSSCADLHVVEKKAFPSWK
jgi:hypothetical protein